MAFIGRAPMEVRPGLEGEPGAGTAVIAGLAGVADVRAPMEVRAGLEGEPGASTAVIAGPESPMLGHPWRYEPESRVSLEHAAQ